MDDAHANELHVSHLKQDIVNACGTIALLHCVVNTPGLKVQKNLNLIENLRQERAITDVSEKTISDLHSHFANPENLGDSGTLAPSNWESTQMHYVVLKKVGNLLILLDGRVPHVLYINADSTLTETLSNGSLRLPESFEMMRYRVLS